MPDWKFVVVDFKVILNQWRNVRTLNCWWNVIDLEFNSSQWSWCYRCIYSRLKPLIEFSIKLNSKIRVIDLPGPRIQHTRNQTTVSEAIRSNQFTSYDSHGSRNKRSRTSSCEYGGMVTSCRFHPKLFG